MSDSESLREGDVIAGEPATSPPSEPSLIWAVATCSLNVDGDVLHRGLEYLVDPEHPKVARLLAFDPPWLLPLPGQGWGDREDESTIDSPSAVE